VRLGRLYSRYPVHHLLLARLGKQPRTPQEIKDLSPPPQPIIEPSSRVREVKVSSREVAAPTPPPFSLGDWQLPNIEILDETAEVELSQAELERRARLIENRLLAMV